MPFDPDQHHRRSIRLPGVDYAEDGAYFVTICTHRHAHIFGVVADDAVMLNTLGCIAEACWAAIPNHFPDVELDAYVIMPNHMHGIIIINRGYDARHKLSPDSPKKIRGGRGESHDDDMVGARHAVPLLRTTESFGKPVSGSISTIVRSYKSATTRQINRTRHTPGAPVWQRNYYEHIIRDEKSLNAIRQYIFDNPARWAADEYCPQNQKEAVASLSFPFDERRF